MNKGETSKILVKNTTMLYIMNITKIILPLVTLPYLTRVLSKDCYGVVCKSGHAVYANCS